MGKKSEQSIYIVVLNYNGWSDTIECIDSLLKVSFSIFNLVIVDNHSTDDSIPKIKNWLEDRDFRYRILSNKDLDQPNDGDNAITLIINNRNGGYGYGNNVGIKYALKKGADYVLVLNNDTVVDPDFLQPLVAACESDKDIGIASGKIRYYDNPDKIWFNGGRFYPCSGRLKHLNFNEKDVGQKPPEEVNFISGCLMFFPVSVFEKTGFFNEDYFMYVEDLEFCQRVIDAGYKLIVSEKSKIFHKVIPDNKKKFSSFSVYWKSRNFIIFLKNYHRSWSRRIISSVFFIIGFNYKLIRVYDFDKIFFLLKGVIDGIRYKRA